LLTLVLRRMQASVVKNATLVIGADLDLPVARREPSFAHGVVPAIANGGNGWGEWRPQPFAERRWRWLDDDKLRARWHDRAVGAPVQLRRLTPSVR